MDTSGKFDKPSVWIEMYQEERRVLAGSARWPSTPGVAERQVRVAQAQGALLAGVIKAILGRALRRTNRPPLRPSSDATCLRSPDKAALHLPPVLGSSGPSTGCASFCG
jgi:hypothetical protein